MACLDMCLNTDFWGHGIRKACGPSLSFLQVHDQDSQEAVDDLLDSNFDFLRAEAIPEEDLQIEGGKDISCSHVSSTDGRKASFTDTCPSGRGKKFGFSNHVESSSCLVPSAKKVSPEREGKNGFSQTPSLQTNSNVKKIVLCILG